MRMRDHCGRGLLKTGTFDLNLLLVFEAMSGSEA